MRSSLIVFAAALLVLCSLVSVSARSPLLRARSSPYPHPGLVRDGEFIRWRPPVSSDSSPASNVTSSWMGNNVGLLGPLTLREMILPGTHDSGAYALTTSMAPDITGSDFMNSLIAFAEKLGLPVQDIITPWALSQTLDFQQQAEAGVRYFDLRVCWNGSDFVTYHFETGNRIDTLLDDLATFLAANPTEIIVVEAQVWAPANVSDGAPVAAKQALIEGVLERFKGLLYPESSALNASYLSLLQNDWRVLFSVNDRTMYDAATAASEQLVWWGPGGHDAPSNASEVIWNTYANTHDLSVLQTYDTLQTQAYNNGSAVAGAPQACERTTAVSGCLYKLSWTLTTDATAIFSSLLPGKPHSLIEMADTANTVLPAFVSQAWLADANLRMGNILIGDDIANSPLVGIVIAENLKAARRRQQRDVAAAAVSVAEE